MTFVGFFSNGNNQTVANKLKLTPQKIGFNCEKAFLVKITLWAKINLCVVLHNSAAFSSQLNIISVENFKSFLLFIETGDKINIWWIIN